jgi:hypothetical protein
MQERVRYRAMDSLCRQNGVFQPLRAGDCLLKDARSQSGRKATHKQTKRDKERAMQASGSASAAVVMRRLFDRSGGPIPAARSLHRLSFSEIAGMIEMAGLQFGARDRDFRERCLRQNLGGDIVDRRIGDLMNEADVFVFAGRNARDDFAPGDFGIDDGLAPAPTVVDHHDEILHGAVLFARRKGAC